MAKNQGIVYMKGGETPPEPQPIPENCTHFDIHVIRNTNNVYQNQYVIEATRMYSPAMQIWSFGPHPKEFKEFGKSRDYRDYPIMNNSRVRIPALWCINNDHNGHLVDDIPGVNARFVLTGIWNHYKRHLGHHVFMFRCALHSIYLFVNPHNHLWYRRLVQMSCIYPILRNTNQPEPRLIMGLIFSPDLTQGLRDFESRLYVYGVNTGGVFNITEGIFEQQKWQEFMHGFADRQMVAIYVCAGARLLVEDGRTGASGWVGPDGSIPIGPNDRTHSYFQQGSLFVYEGTMQLVVPVATAQQNLGQIIENPFNAGNTIFPVNTRQRIRNAYNDQNLKYVIFLGRHHSWTHSSCWKVNVLEDRTQLYVPDGGHILAIETWDRGLEEIYWRHRYERLFDSVVSRLGNTPPVSQIPFERPTEDMIRRILGSDEYYVGGEQQRDFVVNLDQYINDPEFRFQEHYGSGFIERTSLRYPEVQRINTPPLYMPFISAGELVNPNPLEYKSLSCAPHPHGVQFGKAYKYGDKNFTHEKKEMDEHLWKDPIEWNQFMRNGTEFDRRIHRIGVDSQVYTKSHEIVGKVVADYMKIII